MLIPLQAVYHLRALHAEILLLESQVAQKRQEMERAASLYGLDVHTQTFVLHEGGPHPIGTVLDRSGNPIIHAEAGGTDVHG